MADTLSLDIAVQFAISRGASVRLVGDDQQLAAIGAGGVLRDITHTHGALCLTELHRFTDPAEAAASLALREGKPEALDFYLDHGRVHVGDVATTTEDAFSAWVSDRSAGLDAIMIAPTRNLVTELNARARAHRLNHMPAVSEVSLADGNRASVGDVIITRTNDRRLRLAPTDWVKNGDRWTVTHVGQQGDLRVRHNRSQLTVRLPADYVRESAGLGYATTIHTAQGVSADTMHGLATGQETRQQLYTMLTRGRVANHLYLQVVGDGDPHTVIRPETVAPRTPTEILQQILARDVAPTSATTLLRQISDPAARLLDAVQRYTDGLHVAAEQLVGPQIVQMLDAEPTRSSPSSLASRPGRRSEHICSLWRLRPVSTHSSTCTQRPPDENYTPPADMAAVLDWRLPEPAATDPGPLPWLPGIPEALHDHPVWGQYLAKRAELIADLAAHVRRDANEDSTPPVWATPGSQPSVALIGEVEVWRAANAHRPEGPRPTGAGQLQTAAALWQHTTSTEVLRTAATTSVGSDARAHQAARKHRRHEDQQRMRQPLSTRPSSPPGPGW